MLTFHYQISLIKKIKNIYREYSCSKVTGSLMSKHYSRRTGRTSLRHKVIRVNYVKTGRCLPTFNIDHVSNSEIYLVWERAISRERVQNSFPMSNLKLRGLRRNPIGNRVIPVFSGQNPCTRIILGILQSFLTFS